MAYLIDSNIFIRIAKKPDPDRQTALDAVNILRANGEDLCYTSQVLAEFWNVCTRPTTARDGLGLSLRTTERKAKIIERFFRLLPDSLAVHQEWRRLLVAYSVSGVQVHDTRLVAAMNVHGVTHLLSFNRPHFKRFSGITVMTPDEIVNPPAQSSPF